MKHKIRGLNLKTSGALIDHARDKIVEPLSQFAGRVRDVVIRFKDVDRADHGSQRWADAVVTLNSGEVIRVRQKSRCLYAATDMLADRVRRAVNRRVERLRDLHRRERGRLAW